MGTTTTQLNTADDVTNLNQGESELFLSTYEEAFNRLMGVGSALEGYSSNVQPNRVRPHRGTAETFAGYDYDPMSGYQAFMGMQPALQGLISGATSDYAQGQFAMADTQANKAREQTWNELAAAGLVEGGQTGGSLYEADFVARQQALNNVTGMQTQLYGGLANNMLSTMPGQFQAKAQMGHELGMFNTGELNRMSQFNVAQANQMQQFGAEQALQAQMFNQQSELQALMAAGELYGGGTGSATGGYGSSQNWWSPDYEATNWATDFWMPMLGTIIGAGAQAAMSGGTGGGGG